MIRISMLGVALAALTLAGCHCCSSQKQSYCCPRPTAVAVPAAPCPTPCPPGGAVGVVPPPPPPGLIR
jgi:hypothetical protein